MPKKRKLDAEEKEDTLNSDDVEVKTERLSQEDLKGSPAPVDEDGKRAAGRNLRPRKSTCYAEKDSPEVEFEEKLKKIPRRKRRPTLSEDGSEEKESKIKRNDKDSEESATPSKVPLPSDEVGGTKPPLPTLVSCLTLTENEDLSNEGENSNCSTAVLPVSEEGDQLPKVPEKKRPRKKPKVKSDPPEESPIDPNVVPKAEPVSPSAAVTENKEKQEETGEIKKEEQLAIPPKPKKKRIRKKPTLPTVCKTEGQPEETKAKIEGDSTIKKEGGEGENRTADGEKGKEGEDATKPAPPPRKRPPKKKAKTEVKPDPGNPEEKVAPNDSSCSDLPKEGEESNEIKKTEDGEKPVVAATVPRKRVKNRTKKPITEKVAENEGGNKPGESKEGEEKQREGEEEKKKTLEPVNVNEPAGPAPPPPTAAALIRRPFFRGRRSKSFSARSGRKEIIYTDEAIDPEDIKGFEHVEKYVAPDGVRLPKFWDSEDEMSEDENNDNFRRIMCGFGTNCRIHEVIRPASEIVRRLKELQNTFGATKSLPLFKKAESETKENSFVVDSTDPFFRKDRPIVWHTDPSFFKYANNYPSKCK